MKDKPIHALLVALATALLCHASLARADDPPDEQLRAMCLVPDSSSYSKAVAVAARQQNTGVLVYCITNSDYDAKIAAVEAVAKLPRSKAKAALLSVLNTDGIWSHRYRTGGEVQVEQYTFNATLKETIRQVLGVDFTAKDLFVAQNRQDLAAAVRALP